MEDGRHLDASQKLLLLSYFKFIISLLPFAGKHSHLPCHLRKIQHGNAILVWFALAENK